MRAAALVFNVAFFVTTSVPSFETALSGIAHFEKSRSGRPGVIEWGCSRCVADEDDCDKEVIELEYGGGLSSFDWLVGVACAVGRVVGFPMLFYFQVF